MTPCPASSCTVAPTGTPEGARHKSGPCGLRSGHHRGTFATIESGPVADIDAVRELAYMESHERLVAQERDLDLFRTRLGAILTVATAAAALLGGAAFAGAKDGRFETDCRLWVGLAFLAGVALVNLFGLWPRDYYFRNDARIIIDDYAEAGRSLSDTHHWLAQYNARHADINEKFFRKFGWAVALAGGFVVGEVGFLTWFLVSNA